jgi:FKBP-type peptidyl-prolyl cis-trans isomerase FklB
MKKWGMALGILLLAASLCGAEEPVAATGKAPDAATAVEKAPKAATTPEQKAPEATGPVDMNKVSYAIGMLLGKNMKTDGIDLKIEPFVKGFNDTISGATPTMTEEEIRQVMTAFSVEMAAKKEAQVKKLSEESKAKEEAFLSENKKKEGVQVLPSGLQYKIVKDGTGKKPTAKDSVTVNYRGSLIGGKEFDSSYSRNEPATFPVGGVIPGWTEALQLMKSGSKWEIYIPSKLAYGETGVGEVIPPNSTLIFEVELLSVKPGEEKKAAAKVSAKTKAKPKAVKPAAKTAGQGAKSDN